jgi:hypothetical protein
MCLNVSDTNDPREDVTQKIIDHMKKKGIDLDRSEIDKFHSKGKFKEGLLVNRKVIVKFNNSSARQRIYDARRILATEFSSKKTLLRIGKTFI